MKQQKGTGVLDKPLEVVKFAETLTKKMIPSTKPVFDRYWKGDIAKNAFTGPNGVTSKKFWTHPKKGTVMRLVKNPKFSVFRPEIPYGSSRNVVAFFVEKLFLNLQKI